ncbi:DUF2946 domain-containing protein [Advenella sp. RU8]|uniref:DUF2946 domain-containing protein n=1 Tax=Advenella sp. RU8 TaxID=3399575 RepID=UPI003AACA851
MNRNKNRTLYFASWVVLIVMTLVAVSPSVSSLLHNDSLSPFTIEICDSSGNGKTLIINNTSPDQDSSAHTTNIHCLFCLLSELQAAIVTLACILLLGFIARQIITFVSYEWQLLFRTIRWRPNRSQAPPLFS